MLVYVNATEHDFVTGGGLAQLVERVLSMHEVWGSIPQISNIMFCFQPSNQQPFSTLIQSFCPYYLYYYITPHNNNNKS